MTTGARQRQITFYASPTVWEWLKDKDKTETINAILSHHIGSGSQDFAFERIRQLEYLVHQLLLMEGSRIQKWLSERMEQLNVRGTSSLSPDGRSVIVHIWDDQVSFDLNPHIEGQLDCFLRLLGEDSWILGAAMSLKRTEVTEEEISAQYADLPGFIREQHEYLDFEDKVKYLVADLKASKLDYPVDLFFQRASKDTLHVRSPRD